MSGDRRFFGQEASHGVTQRDLFVAQFQVHERGNPRTRCAVMFLLICVVPPAMVSERERQAVVGPPARTGARAQQIERQRCNLLPDLAPDRLGKTRRAECVPAMQNRRDRTLTKHFQILDPQGDLAEAPQRCGVFEHGPAVDLDAGEVPYQLAQSRVHLGVEARRACAFVAERRGGNLPAAVDRSEHGIGRDLNIVEEHFREVSIAGERDQWP